MRRNLFFLRLISAAAAAWTSAAAKDGDGSIHVTGDLETWHKVTLTLQGPHATEQDTSPNPFTDYALEVSFTHEAGDSGYTVPGYFAADGNAAQTSATAGTCWRVHFAPDRPGTWNYEVSFLQQTGAAFETTPDASPVPGLHGKKGMFQIAATSKARPDFRARGRLGYAGRHHLQFAGDGSWFLKAGADAPETLLAYADFDGTRANNPSKCPLKTWSAHEGDWNPGDPTWKDGKGKGLIGALNYLSSKGANVFSFLPYNAGGDGDNVWPFVERDAPLHYDCSKLDQWGILFDHATTRGLYLHFKLQETENDDNRRGKDRKGPVPTALDGGDLGPERKLYCRELIARFGHLLALNWNLGEENTQTFEQQRDMAQWIRDLDPYDHPIVIHTYPNEQDKVYRPHLGPDSLLAGLSLQNSNVKDCHRQVIKWVRASEEAGQPWVVAFDEPGDAQFGMPPDADWPGMAELRAGIAEKAPTVDDTRKYALWGSLLAGGGGVEYYFGYKLPENDLRCENWRSRDESWDYCRIALEFFSSQQIPFWDMKNRDDLVGNPDHGNSRYCFAREGSHYLVYLPAGGSCELAIKPEGFRLAWFNPRTGELGEQTPWKGPGLQAPTRGDDWLAVVRATEN